MFEGGGVEPYWKFLCSEITPEINIPMLGISAVLRRVLVCVQPAMMFPSCALTKPSVSQLRGC